MALHQILAGQYYSKDYMLGTTTKLLMLFQVLGLWLYLKYYSIVTEIIIKKYRKETKNVKRCRDGMPKSIQTR